MAPQLERIAEVSMEKEVPLTHPSETTTVGETEAPPDRGQREVGHQVESLTHGLNFSQIEPSLRCGRQKTDYQILKS